MTLQYNNMDIYVIRPLRYEKKVARKIQYSVIINKNIFPKNALIVCIIILWVEKKSNICYYLHQNKNQTNKSEKWRFTIIKKNYRV